MGQGHRICEYLLLLDYPSSWVGLCGYKFNNHFVLYSAFSTEHFIATMDEQIKMADSSLPSNHHVVIDSLTVLLRRQGLPAVATLLHTLPGSQLTSELSFLLSCT